jgi:hypothetical protein
MVVNAGLSAVSPSMVVNAGASLCPHLAAAAEFIAPAVSRSGCADLIAQVSGLRAALLSLLYWL